MHSSPRDHYDATPAARAVSEQVIAIHQTDRSARWEAIGLRLISRPLSHDELAVVEQAYLEQYAYFQTRPESTAAFLHIGQRPVDSSIDAIDLASTSVVAGMLMCFDS
jgi:hypothetical protein